MDLSMFTPLNSKELAEKFEAFKRGELTVNEFAVLAISKTSERLRLIFINDELPFDQFDDVVSDLSLSILRVLNNNNWDTIQNPSAYFTKIATNLIVDLIRKLATQVPTSSQLDKIAIENYEINQIDLLESLCLAMQDDFDCEIVGLRTAGYTRSEISTKLNKPLSTISFRLTKLQMRYEQNIKEA